MDKEKTAERLNEFFGNKTVKVVIPKDFLVSLKAVFATQNEYLAKQIEKNQIPKELVEENKAIRGLLVNLEKAIRMNKIDRVEITNLDKIPKPKEPQEITIPEYPKEISVKKPTWYEKFIPDKILQYIERGFKQSGQEFREALDRHKIIENALAVKLVDKDSKTFYTAMMAAFSGGGNIQVANFPEDFPDVASTALLTTIDADTGAISLALASLGKAEDAAHVSGDTGVMALAVRKDTQAALAADGDYIPLITDSSGALYTLLTNATIEKTNNAVAGTLGLLTGGKYESSPTVLDDGDYGLLLLDTNRRLMISGQGDVAHDGADSGFPLKIGGKASTTAPTAVAASDRVNAWFDLQGRNAVFSSYSFANITTNTTTTVKSGAGVLHAIIINNIGTTETITIYDNTAASGTKIATTANLVGGNVPNSVLFDLAFGTGLTIVTAGAAACDITVVYL